MREELAREAVGKVTGKKKKRLDKYIVRLSTSESLHVFMAFMRERG
jgi:hypothetical protein